MRRLNRMTLEVLYRRSLVAVALLAVSVAALAGYSVVAFGGSTALGVAIASLALAAGALVARRGRLWRSILVLAMGSGFCAAAAMALVPWWAALPAGLGLAAFALLVPAMLRRDRLAAVVVSVLGAAFGVQGAWAVDAATRRPVATLDEVEVTAPDVEQSEASWHGRAHAERDLAAGRWRLMTYGCPEAYRELYAETLRRGGIELEAVAGCVVRIDLVEYASGYNQVMEAAIGRLLGPNYLSSRRQACEDAMDFDIY